MSNLRYEIVITWSREDNCCLVQLPDFPEQTYRTHGNSYEEAARNGQEILQLLLEEDGLPLPNLVSLLLNMKWWVVPTLRLKMIH